MTLSAGSRLGPYEVIALLGAGGMGEVYRARDPRLNRDVAIKVLPPTVASDADRLRRFEQEARAAGALNHPNILAVHDFGSHEGAPYVVSELLEGETLRSRLATGAPAPRRAVDLALQIAQGMGAAHDKGIVHRDLKPENVFLTEDGRVKILDFGLAKLVQPEIPAAEQTAAPTATRGTEPGIVMGTVGYMSPEQVRGQAADHRSDIFSFGAILYEMLSGRRAFRGETAVETMSAILKEDPPELLETNRNLSPGLERLVRHCLEKSPAQRFQSARDLAYDLESLSESSGATVAARALAAPAGKRRVLWPAVAALALVLGIAGGFFASSRLRPPRLPTYKQLTFRRGWLGGSRFAPDGHGVLYTASWNGEEPRIFSARPESPESSALDLPSARLAAVSPTGELAILLAVGGLTNSDDQTTLARVPLSGGAPREVLKGVGAADWSPDGKELAVSHWVDGKVRVEFPMGRVVYNSTGEVISLRISPGGDLVAIADRIVTGDTEGQIVVLDRSGQVRGRSSRWFDLGSLAWSPDGNEVWFSASRSGNRRSLWAVTLSGRERLIADVPGAVNMMDMNSAGQALVWHYTFRSSAFGRLAGEADERDFSWLDFSTPIAISTDGKTLLFEEWGEAGGANGSVYLRRLDGSQPVRLGDGLAMALSPDGRWVLTRLYTTPPRLVLLPTGAGQVTPVPGEGLQYGESAGFLPDGKRLVFEAHENNGPFRLYVQELTGGKARPFTGEVGGGEQLGIVVSPDGKAVAWPDSGRMIRLYSIENGDSRLAAGVQKSEIPVLWETDGRHMIVQQVSGFTLVLTRVDLGSGKRELWKELRPSDPSGVSTWNYSSVISRDGKSYFWGVQRQPTELYLVDGLK